MKKILFTLAVSCFSVTYAQNINFTDQKFKALILSSNSNNDIAKDSNGNNFAIDANGDGEIQASEAQQVKILTLRQDPNQKLIDPNGNPYDPANINVSYYNSHLPDGISDALLFKNIEELYFYEVKSANISFINNSKIKKVQGRPIYYDYSQASSSPNPAPINFKFDNCSGIQNINDIIAYTWTSYPWSSPENSLTIKNLPQFNGNISINQADLRELYIYNTPLTSLTFNSCILLEKISVPNLNTLTKVSVLGAINSVGTAINQNIQLIANNCRNLQEVIADTDHSDSNGAYFSSVNLSGNINLKKIKGLNAASVNLSSMGLRNLEELDVAYYNRYGYNTTSGSYFGSVTSLNLTGLPKLKTLIAFNQPITSNVNFSAASKLQLIDITNSSGYMNTVNVSNLRALHTLTANRTANPMTQGNDNLQKIIAKNCIALGNIEFGNNNILKELDFQNCLSLKSLQIGNYVPHSNGIFSELNKINISQCSALENLYINGTKITTLNTADCISLKELSLHNNTLLSTINITNNKLLEDLQLEYLPLLNTFSTLQNTKLKLVNFTDCPLVAQLDLSNASSMEFMTLKNMTNLTSVKIKNGVDEEAYIVNPNANLSVCVDNSQLATLQGIYPTVNFNTSCTSNNGNQINNLIKVVPNPARIFTMVMSPENITNVKIINAQGLILLNQNANAKNVVVNLSSLPSGTYLLHIKTVSSEVTKNLIKQ